MKYNGVHNFLSVIRYFFKAACRVEKQMRFPISKSDWPLIIFSGQTCTDIDFSYRAEARTRVGNHFL